MLFAAKKACTMCGRTYKAKEMFIPEADSPLMANVTDAKSVYLCNACSFSYRYIYDERYKKDSVENAYKFFASQNTLFLTRQSNQVLSNFRKLLDEFMGGYSDYRVFQNAMHQLYAHPNGSVVVGYFAVNEEKRCFSIIRNEHIGLPRNAENLEEVSLVEEGDEEYVKKCDVVFTYKNPAQKPDVINMFSTTGIARSSTIYKETMDTYQQIKLLADKIR